jgi:hypothetical protein
MNFRVLYLRQIQINPKHIRRKPAEIMVILHDPLEEVNGKQRAFGAYGQEVGARGGGH